MTETDRATATARSVRTSVGEEGGRKGSIDVLSQLPFAQLPNLITVPPRCRRSTSSMMCSPYALSSGLLSSRACPSACIGSDSACSATGCACWSGGRFLLGWPCIHEPSLPIKVARGNPSSINLSHPSIAQRPEGEVLARCRFRCLRLRTLYTGQSSAGE